MFAPSSFIPPTDLPTSLDAEERKGSEGSKSHERIPKMDCMWMALSHVPFSDKVCVAGSFALHTLMTMSSDLDTPAWKCGDADIFVCGTKTENDFRSFVDTVIHRIEEETPIVLTQVRFRSDLLDSQLSMYGAVFPTKLSFIRHTFADTVAEITPSFDIDVCRVLLHLDTKKEEVTFTVSNKVKAAIQAKRATACKMRESVTAEPEHRFLRVLKYRHRGFEVVESEEVIDSMYIINYFKTGTRSKCPTVFTEADAKREKKQIVEAKKELDVLIKEVRNKYFGGDIHYVSVQNDNDMSSLQYLTCSSHRQSYSFRSDVLSAVEDLILSIRLWVAKVEAKK